MPARLAALDDDRIRTHTHELAGESERRCKTNNPRATFLDSTYRRASGQSAREYDMTNLVSRADTYQIEQLWVERD